MASGGAGGGGASSSNSSSSSSSSSSRVTPSLYTSPGVLLSAVYRQSRAAGDLKLALLTTPVYTEGVYTYCGHGAVNLYDDARAGEWIRSPIVPPGCAYITTAELGCPTSSADEGDKAYRDLWGDKEDAVTLEAILLDCRTEAKARRTIEGLFPTSDDKRTTAIIRVAKDRYADSYVLPCFMSHDAVEEVKKGKKVYAFPSGIQECRAGVDLNAGMEVVGDVVTKEIIEFMYRGSIFPTVDEVMGTTGMAEILLQDPSPGVPARPNRSAFIKRIYDEWTCTAKALLLSFPGVHVNTLCAYPGSETVRDLLVGANVQRRASEAGTVRRIAQLSPRELDTLEVPVLLRRGDLASLPWETYDSDGIQHKRPPDMDPRTWSPSDVSWAIGELLTRDAPRLGLEGSVYCKPSTAFSASTSCTLARHTQRTTRTTRTKNRRRRSKSKTRRNC
jgi:hypothetical protein